MSTRFVGSATWLGLLDNPSPFARRDQARSLSTADVDDLLMVFAEGSDAERVVALGFLRQLSQSLADQPNAPWSAAHRTRLVSALAARTRAYFAGSLAWSEGSGSIVRALWRLLEPEAFVTFVLGQPVRQMEAAAQGEVLAALAATAGEQPRAREWLNAAVATGGEFGARAQDALEGEGLVSEERVRFWSRKWREERDQDALDWLYDKWLSYLPLGYPLAELLAVLGPPDDGDPPDLYYGGADGHVYVEAYEATGYSGCHRA